MNRSSLPRRISNASGVGRPAAALRVGSAASRATEIRPGTRRRQRGDGAAGNCRDDRFDRRSALRQNLVNLDANVAGD